MSKTKKKQHPGIAKKIIVTLLCIIVLTVLGLSIASNVQLYNKVTELNAALGTTGKPGDELGKDNQFKPIDSATPVTLRADGEGQHLYLNLNKADLNEFNGTEKIFLIALEKPYSGDEKDLYEIFDGDYAFVIQSYGSGLGLFAPQGECSLYNYKTGEFGEGVTDEGIIVFDTVLDKLGVDTVYLYPMISLVTVQILQDIKADINSIASVDEVNSVFAFSLFELKPEEEKPPVEDPPVSELKPIDLSVPVSFQHDDSEHLYINTDEAIWADILENKDQYSDPVMIFVGLKEPYDGTQEQLNEIFGGDRATFIISVQKSCTMVFITDDAAGWRPLSDFIDGNGQISFEEFGIGDVYLYDYTSLIPEDHLEDVKPDRYLSLDEINRLFAFSPFEK